jgi:hypothetical protein
LNNLPNAPAEEPNEEKTCVQKKQLVITGITTLTREDELALKIIFKPLPTKNSFSTVQTELWFDNQPIHSTSIKLLQGPLATEEYEFTPVLGMKGISAGLHILRVEMYEFWPPQERRYGTSMETTVDYVPKTRESQLIRVPIVKTVAGTGLSVISEPQKELYDEIEKTTKKEYIANRDGW